MADINEVRGNLRADLNSSITDTATSLTVNNEFTSKTVPSDGYLAIGEQQDFTDSTFEVVRYSGFTRNGDGTSTFSSLTRGLDNTSASSWSSGITVGTNIPGNLLARIPQQQESLNMGGNSITNQSTGYSDFNNLNEPTAGTGITDEGSKTFGQNVIKSGSVTLSSGVATVSTGITTAGDTLMLALGISDPDVDCEVAGTVFWDDSAGENKVKIKEVDTSVGNPTVNYKVIKVS